MMRIRNRRARMAYTLSTALVAVSLVAVLVSGCASWEEQLDARKAAATQLLVQNGQLREFLENDIYGLSGDVYITTNKDIGIEAAVILSDGKLTIPAGYDLDWHDAVKGHESTIVELFTRFQCVSIVLEQPGNADSKRVMSVIFDDFKIGGDRYYSEFLSYSRDGAVEMAENVMTNWYYSARLYP